MDFYLATPQGEVHLFSSEDGRTVQIPAPAAAPQAGADPAPPAPGQ
ncbi:hypothetical protein [Massilia sp.]|nr:hypothetical protein [Massilia sp.]